MHGRWWGSLSFFLFVVGILIFLFIIFRFNFNFWRHLGLPFREIFGILCADLVDFFPLGCSFFLCSSFFFPGYFCKASLPNTFLVHIAHRDKLTLSPFGVYNPRHFGGLELGSLPITCWSYDQKHTTGVLCRRPWEWPIFRQHLVASDARCRDTPEAFVSICLQIFSVSDWLDRVHRCWAPSADSGCLKRSEMMALAKYGSCGG